MKATKKKLRWGSSWRCISTETEKACQKIQFVWQKYIFQRNIWTVDTISIKRKDPILPKWYNMAMLSTNCWALKVASLDEEERANVKKLPGNKHQPWTNRVTMFINWN